MPIAAPSSRRVSNRSNGEMLVEQRRRHVEAAAVDVEIDEGQRARVGKAGA